MVAEIALLIGLMVIAYLIITTIPATRRIRRLKRELRIEQTRACWAEARAQLMALARDRKLSTESQTFRNFYGIQTFVLRRPEEYRAIAQEVAQTILTKSPERPGWQKEVQNWPAEMREVVALMRHGTGRLIGIHSGRRFLLGIALWIAPRLAMHLSNRLYRKIVRLAKQVGSLSEDLALSAAMNRMEALETR